jgi:hypothetical protein
MHKFTTNQLHNAFILIIQRSYRFLPFILAIFRKLQVWSMCVVHIECNLQFSGLNNECTLNCASHQEHCIGNAWSAHKSFQWQWHREKTDFSVFSSIKTWGNFSQRLWAFRSSFHRLHKQGQRKSSQNCQLRMLKYHVEQPVQAVPKMLGPLQKIRMEILWGANNYQ